MEANYPRVSGVPLKPAPLSSTEDTTSFQLVAAEVLWSGGRRSGGVPTGPGPLEITSWSCFLGDFKMFILGLTFFFG